MKEKATARNIDEYIADFPVEVREILEKIRFVIQEAAPEAKEIISYQMPAFAFHGVLVYFAAYKQHIGFYPTSSGIEEFKDEFAPYKHSKGTLRFLLNQEIPYDLIRRIVKFRVKENEEKAKTKAQKIIKH